MKNVSKACINLETGVVHPWTPRIAVRNDMKTIWYDHKAKKVLGEAPNNATEEQSKSSDPVINLVQRPNDVDVNARNVLISDLDRAIQMHAEAPTALTPELTDEDLEDGAALTVFETKAKSRTKAKAKATAAPVVPEQEPQVDETQVEDMTSEEVPPLPAGLSLGLGDLSASFGSLNGE
jgi:hypothetical protein